MSLQKAARNEAQGVQVNPLNPRPLSSRGALRPLLAEDLSGVRVLHRGGSVRASLEGRSAAWLIATP